MTERAFDQTIPGGIYQKDGKFVNADGEELPHVVNAQGELVDPTAESDAPRPVAGGTGDQTVPPTVPPLASSAVQAQRDRAASVELPTVADLDAFLGEFSDAAAVRSLQARDDRVTAQDHYAARLAAITPGGG